jgi:hypothetical protein
MDVVALTSVIVTGVVSPAIAVAAARLDRRSEGRRADRTQVWTTFDAAADAMLAARTSYGHLSSLWSGGRDFDDREAQETWEECRRSLVLLRQQYGRLCSRFGSQSDLTKEYAACISAIREVIRRRGGYKNGKPYDEVREFWDTTLAEVDSGVERFCDIGANLARDGFLGSA